MPCFAWTSRLSCLAAGALLLAVACRRDRELEAASPADASAPRLQTWDHCLAQTDVGKPLERLEGFLERPGTVAFDDAGCDWMTVDSDAGIRTVTRRKVFGTLLRYDAARGATVSAPDVRIVSKRTDARLESFEWRDRDGDGRHEVEKRGTFGPEGDERSGELIVWNAEGAPIQRNLFTVTSLGKRHVVDQLFLDGGWKTTNEYDSVDRCEYRPIVPIRAPGK